MIEMKAHLESLLWLRGMPDKQTYFYMHLIRDPFNHRPRQSHHKGVRSPG